MLLKGTRIFLEIKSRLLNFQIIIECIIAKSMKINDMMDFLSN